MNAIEFGHSDFHLLGDSARHSIEQRWRSLAALVFGSGRYMVAIAHDAAETGTAAALTDGPQLQAERLAGDALTEMSQRVGVMLGMGVWDNQGATLIRWEPGPAHYGLFPARSKLLTLTPDSKTVGVAAAGVASAVAEAVLVIAPHTSPNAKHEAARAAAAAAIQRFFRGLVRDSLSDSCCSSRRGS